MAKINMSFGNLADRCLEYNLIISTNERCYDTTNYNFVTLNPTFTYQNIYNGTPKVLFLIKTTPDVTQLPTTPEKVKQIDIICEKEVVDIKIKSKRNFIFNQNVIRKKNN